LKIEITRKDDRIYESMDYYFIPDEKILGEWQSIEAFSNDGETYNLDFEKEIYIITMGEHYQEIPFETLIDIYLERDNNDTYWKTMTIYDDGKAKIEFTDYSLYTNWTNGFILNVLPDTISEYVIINYNGSDYIFAEWKSGDYTYRGAKPLYYIFKKISDCIPDDLSKYDTIERNYQWYIDQYDTGEYNNMNCGPTCAVMAAKWYNENFQITAEEVRNHYTTNEENGGWYFDELVNFFNMVNIPYEKYRDIKYEDFSMHLDMGNIMMVGVDMKFIKTNKFYSNTSYHYLIIKGKQTVDGKDYFEIYDPYSWQAKDSEGNFKGENCLYLSTEVIEAAKNWGDYYLVI